MRVLIVAKTRRGAGACIDGITAQGRSVRLIAADPQKREHAGLKYAIGDWWDLETVPAVRIVPPHVEDVLVKTGSRLRPDFHPERVIRSCLPPVNGGPGALYEGFLQVSTTGALYISEQTGVPSRSTMFWIPDQPLAIDTDSKRIRYRYPTSNGGCTLTFVGFQEPLDTIPAGMLLRVSLAIGGDPKTDPGTNSAVMLNSQAGSSTNPSLTRTPSPLQSLDRLLR